MWGNYAEIHSYVGSLRLLAQGSHCWCHWEKKQSYCYLHLGKSAPLFCSWLEQPVRLDSDKNRQLKGVLILQRKHLSKSFT